MKFLFVSFLLVTFLTCCKGKDDTFDVETHKSGWKKCKASDSFEEAENLDKEWLMKNAKKGWYYIMSHRWAIIEAAEALSGKAPKSHKSIEKACFAKQWTPNGYLVHGYGKNTEFECKTDKHGMQSDCKPAKANDKIQNVFGGVHPTIVWTDNKSCVIGARCINKYKVWALLCTENKDISPKLKKVIIKEIVGRGCRAEDAIVMPRKGCADMKEYEEED